MCNNDVAIGDVAKWLHNHNFNQHWTLIHLWGVYNMHLQSWVASNGLYLDHFELARVVLLLPRGGYFHIVVRDGVRMMDR